MKPKDGQVPEELLEFRIADIKRWVDRISSPSSSEGCRTFSDQAARISNSPTLTQWDIKKEPEEYVESD